MQRLRTLAGRLRGFLRQPLGRSEDPFDGTLPLLLFLDDVYPVADRDSGSLTTLSYIQMFIDLGYRVVFAAVREFSPPQSQRGDLENMGVTCVGPEQFSSIEELLERKGECFAVCFLCRVVSGGRFFETVRQHCKSAKIIFDVLDLHFLRASRRAKVEAAEGDELRMNRIAERKARELELVRKADASIVVSSFEKQLLEKAVPGALVWHFPLFRECPGRAAPFSTRSGIGYIGNFGFQANGDSVRYFLEEIWPLVRIRLPGAQFFIIGSAMPEEFRSLSTPGVIVVGHAPDLAEPLAKLRMTVAPIRWGAGAKGKVVSSLAHGIPCVASEIGAEGIDLVDGKHILIGRDPAHFAEQIVRLHEDEVLWNALSEAGLAHVQEHHSFKAGRARMRKLLDEIGAP